MDHAAPIRRFRGVFAAALDVFVAFAGLAVVTALLMAALDARANRAAAHMYARELKVPDQAGCPSAAGNGFWFSCAAEVRRTHPEAALAKDAQSEPAQTLPPHAPTP